MVSSPFPVMDPLFEIDPRWEVFHGWFIRELARQSTGLARELGCEVDVERSVYGQEPTGELVLLGEPDLLAEQQYIVVREAGDWPRVLAVVELLSFANKQGRIRYPRSACRSAPAVRNCHSTRPPRSGRRTT